jgi:hypothetical protein
MCACRLAERTAHEQLDAAYVKELFEAHDNEGETPGALSRCGPSCCKLGTRVGSKVPSDAQRPPVVTAIAGANLVLPWLPTPASRRTAARRLPAQLPYAWCSWAAPSPSWVGFMRLLLRLTQTYKSMLRSYEARSQARFRQLECARRRGRELGCGCATPLSIVCARCASAPLPAAVFGFLDNAIVSLAAAVAAVAA